MSGNKDVSDIFRAVHAENPFGYTRGEAVTPQRIVRDAINHAAKVYREELANAGLRKWAIEQAVKTVAMTNASQTERGKMVIDLAKEYVRHVVGEMCDGPTEK